MNKGQLVEKIAVSADISKNNAKKALDCLMESVKEELKTGGEVSLIGFGSFIVRERTARLGRNPQTGAEIQIAAAKIPAFKPGKALKDAVNS